MPDSATAARLPANDPDDDRHHEPDPADQGLKHAANGTPGEAFQRASGKASGKALGRFGDRTSPGMQPDRHPHRPPDGLAARVYRDRTLLLFVTPGVVLLLVFHYLPLLGNVIAFQDYLPFLGIGGSQWVGLRNFSILFNGDPAFLNALKNTLELTLIQSIFVFPVPLGLALVLNSLLSARIKGFVQSVLLLPHFLSWVIVVALFQEILGGSGAVNHVIRQLGGHGVDFLTNPHLFFGVIASQAIWKDTGWAAILFLAALSQISPELYEASSVDGASRTRQMWHITLPGLRGVIILLFILKLGNSLSIGFEQILLQQNAVGRSASEVLDTYVYNNGIINGDWGIAAAVGLVKGVVSVGLVLAANRVAHIFGEAGVYQR